MKKLLLPALLCCCMTLAGADDWKSLKDAAAKAETGKDFKQAVELYVKAAQAAVKPGDRLDALQKAARLLAKEKKNGEAKALLLAFAEDEKTPASQKVMADLACAKLAETEEEAMRFLEQGIARKTGDWTEAACFLGKAKILLNQKKADEAEALFKQVAACETYSDISRAEAFSALAETAAKKKDYAAAHANLEQIRALGKKRYAFLATDASVKEAKLFASEQKYDEALKLWSEIAADAKIKTKTRTDALDSIMTLEFNRGRMDEAKKVLELFKSYGLPVSKKAQKLEKDIKDLTE